MGTRGVRGGGVVFIPYVRLWGDDEGRNEGGEKLWTMHVFGYKGREGP